MPLLHDSAELMRRSEHWCGGLTRALDCEGKHSLGSHIHDGEYVHRLQLARSFLVVKPSEDAGEASREILLSARESLQVLVNAIEINSKSICCVIYMRWEILAQLSIGLCEAQKLAVALVLMISGSNSGVPRDTI